MYFPKDVDLELMFFVNIHNIVNISNYVYKKGEFIDTGTVVLLEIRRRNQKLGSQAHFHFLPIVM